MASRHAGGARWSEEGEEERLRVRTERPPGSPATPECAQGRDRRRAVDGGEFATCRRRVEPKRAPPRAPRRSPAERQEGRARNRLEMSRGGAAAALRGRRSSGRRRGRARARCGRTRPELGQRPSRGFGGQLGEGGGASADEEGAPRAVDPNRAARLSPRFGGRARGFGGGDATAGRRRGAATTITALALGGAHASTRAAASVTRRFDDDGADGAAPRRWPGAPARERGCASGVLVLAGGVGSTRVRGGRSAERPRRWRPSTSDGRPSASRPEIGRRPTRARCRTKVHPPRATARRSTLSSMRQRRARDASAPQHAAAKRSRTCAAALLRSMHKSRHEPRAHVLGELRSVGRRDQTRAANAPGMQSRSFRKTCV